MQDDVSEERSILQNAGQRCDNKYNKLRKEKYFVICYSLWNYYYLPLISINILKFFISDLRIDIRT